MTTNKNTNNVVSQNTTVQEELRHAIKQANERNRTQRAANFETQDTVVIWTMKVGDAHPTIKNRFYAKLYRASAIAPQMSGNKGHAMRGAFKPVTFQFDAKTGEIFTLSWETKERVNAVMSVSWLVEEFAKGKHAIANGNLKTSGYDQTKKPRFADWRARYDGKVKADDAFVASKLDSDLQKIERD